MAEIHLIALSSSYASREPPPLLQKSQRALTGAQTVYVRLAVMILKLFSYRFSPLPRPPRWGDVKVS